MLAIKTSTKARCIPGKQERSSITWQRRYMKNLKTTYVWVQATTIEQQRRTTRKLAQSAIHPLSTVIIIFCYCFVCLFLSFLWNYFYFSYDSVRLYFGWSPFGRLGAPYLQTTVSIQFIGMLFFLHTLSKYHLQNSRPIDSWTFGATKENSDRYVFSRISGHFLVGTS